MDLILVAVAAGIAGIIWVAAAPLRIWHITGSDGQEHPDTATWIAYGTGGALIFAALVYLSLRMTAEPAGKAPVRVPVTIPEALGIATALEAGPEPPACGHLNAEPLANRFALRPVAWFCAECDTGLPGEFGDLMRSCCGSAPGTSHAYNCPHRKG